MKAVITNFNFALLVGFLCVAVVLTTKIMTEYHTTMAKVEAVKLQMGLTNGTMDMGPKVESLHRTPRVKSRRVAAYPM